jgi:hypothetical protein
MGLAQVPTILLSGLSETQKRARRIADNKIALNAGWDPEILQQELGELASIKLDIDPTLTGLSTSEIVSLLSKSDETDEVIPSLPVTPRTKPGDIWSLGEHRIGCGDARDAAFLRRVIGDGARADAADTRIHAANLAPRLDAGAYPATAASDGGKLGRMSNRGGPMGRPLLDRDCDQPLTRTTGSTSRTGSTAPP